MQEKEHEEPSAINFSQLFKDMQEVQQGTSEPPVKEKVKEKDNRLKNNIIDGKIIRSVFVSSIRPDPTQPRKNIDPNSQEIRDLAESIKEHGFLNFITVREVEPQDYVIVTGERRYMAAQVAGFERIPVMVVASEKTAQDYAVIQLEENLQRADLTPFEEANAYTRLQQEFHLQQKDIAEMVKKDKTYISKMFRLTKLVEEIKYEIQTLKITVARDVLWELANFSEDEQKVLWEKIKRDPTGTALKQAANVLQQIEEKEQPQEDETSPDPDHVWEALKRAVEKDKTLIFSYLSKKKAQKLLRDFVE